MAWFDDLDGERPSNRGGKNGTGNGVESSFAGEKGGSLSTAPCDAHPVVLSRTELVERAWRHGMSFQWVDKEEDLS